MKTHFIRWIGLFATGAFVLRQFWRISSLANGGVPHAVIKTDAILFGMTIALMSSWFVSALWKKFAKRLASTRIEEQIVTYGDIVSEMWDDAGFGFEEDVVCDPLQLAEDVGRGHLPRNSFNDAGIYQVARYERVV